MYRDEEEDTTIYKVVLNHEEQLTVGGPKPSLTKKL